MKFTQPWHQEEWLKCAKSFEYFASNYIEIRTLKHGSVKFNLYPYQKRVLKEFEGNRFNILRKFRQGGLTTLSVLWGMWLCMFRESKQILVISKTDNEAIKAGKTVQRALDILAEKHPWLMPNLNSESKHTISFFDTKSEIEFGSKARARGQALNYVIIDEAAFIPGMEEVWADMYPTISTGGNVIIISTVNGKGNWYYNMWIDAKESRNGFNAIDLHYTEHPDFSQPGWAEETLKNLGERLFAQEILGSFLGSGETYIKPQILGRVNREASHKRVTRRLFPEWDSDKRLFELHSGSVDPSLHQWDKGALWIWQDPQESHNYIIGVDSAEGVGDEGDSNAFQVIDANTMTQVAEFCSNTVSASDFAMIISRIGIFYNTALVAAENVGPGFTVIDKLENTLCYENLYYNVTRNRERAGVVVTRTTRPLILNSMKEYLENGVIHICSPRLIRELEAFKFDRSKKRAEAESGFHDDLVMAFAIACYIRDQHLRDLPIGVNLPENIADTIANKRYESIRKIIEDLNPEDLFSNESNDEDIWEDGEILPGIQLPFERENEFLLREFGW